MGGIPGFAGSITAVVLDITVVSLHGDLYFDLVVEPEPAAEPRRGMKFRVAQGACENGLAPLVGDRVRIDLLMKQVTKIAVLAG